MNQPEKDAIAKTLSSEKVDQNISKDYLWMVERHYIQPDYAGAIFTLTASPGFSWRSGSRKASEAVVNHKVRHYSLEATYAELAAVVDDPRVIDVTLSPGTLFREDGYRMTASFWDAVISGNKPDYVLPRHKLEEILSGARGDGRLELYIIPGFNEDRHNAFDPDKTPMPFVAQTIDRRMALPGQIGQIGNIYTLLLPYAQLPALLSDRRVWTVQASRPGFTAD